jgi:hypothetical protein
VNHDFFLFFKNRILPVQYRRNYINITVEGGYCTPLRQDARALFSERALREALALTLAAAVIAFTVHFLFDKKERSKALQTFTGTPPFDIRLYALVIKSCAPLA